MQAWNITESAEGLVDLCHAGEEDQDAPVGAAEFGVDVADGLGYHVVVDAHTYGPQSITEGCGGCVVPRAASGIVVCWVFHKRVGLVVKLTSTKSGSAYDLV